ncbi:MAG: hypothetical protein HY683_03035 [Chloroflexi bacterium]|nr:hypothetical protein [Chloroflexota bacterium]
MNSAVIVGTTKALLDRVLAHQSDDGDFLGSDVYTYHFVQALSAISRVAFKSYIDQALDWFAKLEDPRDRNPRSVSPFRLMALVGTGVTLDFQKQAVDKILVNMVGRAGNINLPLGFVEAADSYDPFPTLTAVQILLASQCPDAVPAGKKGLEWVLRRKAEIRRPATLGFLAFMLGEANKVGIVVGKTSAKTTVRSIVRSLTHESVRSELRSDPLQGAYIAFDLAELACSFPDLNTQKPAVDLVSTLIEFRNLDEDNFYKNQDIPLLDLRLLAACGSVLSQHERDRFVESLLETAFDDKIKLARQYRKLQGEAQDVVRRLKALQSVVQGDALFVQPRWSTTNTKVDPSLVFFLMQLPRPNASENLSEMERAFQNHLRPTMEQELGLRVVRADDIFDTRDIMQSIWDSLLTARLVVADLTGRNPNVFYEVGMADVLGKEVVLLSQTVEDVPFDLRNRRVIIYRITYDGINALKRDVVATIRRALETAK